MSVNHHSYKVCVLFILFRKSCYDVNHHLGHHLAVYFLLVIDNNDKKKIFNFLGIEEGNDQLYISNYIFSLCTKLHPSLLYLVSGFGRTFTWLLWSMYILGAVSYQTNCSHFLKPSLKKPRSSFINGQDFKLVASPL